MALPVATRITPEEYLEAERKAEFRSEYLDGYVYAMAGATEPHEDICSNLMFYSRLRLQDRDCRVYGSNMKVGTAKKKGYFYPDLSIVCGRRVFYDDVRDVLTNATVVFEVLSDSTRQFDLSSKLGEYMKLQSLRHFVAIDQKVQRVVHCTRQDDNQWLYATLENESDIVKLTALEIELPLSEVYHRVDLEEAAT